MIPKCAQKYCNNNASIRKTGKYNKFCSRGCATREPNPENLFNKRFGKLLVLDNFRYTELKNNKDGAKFKLEYLCKCDCGNEKYIHSKKLYRDLSCGCNQVNKKGKLPPGECGFNTVISTYKGSARIRNLEFNLTREEMRKLLSDNCYYCGAKPSNILPGTKKRNGDFVYNGIDRINNDIGYNSNNCVSCCKNCNYFKSNRNINEFLELVTNIYKYRILHD